MLAGPSRSFQLVDGHHCDGLFVRFVAWFAQVVERVGHLALAVVGWVAVRCHTIMLGLIGLNDNLGPKHFRKLSQRPGRSPAPRVSDQIHQPTFDTKQRGQRGQNPPLQVLRIYPRWRKAMLFGPLMSTV